jgi:hypothetical protein
MGSGASDLRQLLASLGLGGPDGLDGLGDLGGALEEPGLAAVGWATVDGERTIAGLTGIEFRVVDTDALLGARTWRADIGAIALLVLEPTMEGRLAAALARHGEGIVSLYLTTPGPPGGVTGQTALGVPGRLLPHDRPWGPFVIEVPSTADLPPAER